MPTWPPGATGRTSLSRPGSGALVMAAPRFSMLTIGQPHIYANRPTALAYSGCMTTPVAGAVTSAAVLGIQLGPVLFRCLRNIVRPLVSTIDDLVGPPV